jgi:hypothetical protein
MRTVVDPDHRAAWLACRKPFERPFAKPGEAPLNLRAALAGLLKAGWSIAALKAYSFSRWNLRRRDHITPDAWRMGIYSASEDTRGNVRHQLSALTFLEEFNAQNGVSVQA